MPFCNKKRKLTSRTGLLVLFAFSIEPSPAVKKLRGFLDFLGLLLFDLQKTLQAGQGQVQHPVSPQHIHIRQEGCRHSFRNSWAPAPLTLSFSLMSGRTYCSEMSNGQENV